MTLAPGSRLGVYEVTELIGHGGMGAVYRAHDARLGRDVAIKVLPEAFSADPDRVARFEREARALASLNHPHIGAIYGLEETPGRAGATVTALVLELVDGPSLADRIVPGPLPLPEALRVAREIADALEAAHERGVVHRDLKPANIKLTAEGSVKVLDFGLAKLVGAHDSDISPSQTMSETLAGAILGTPRYMSPEQARGQAIDKRTDIWSFGCVLYEMLTGRSPFPGETSSDTIAAILNHEPDWRGLPEATPAQVRTLLRRCLEKDSRQRLRDIGDARIELDALIAQRTSFPLDKASAEERGHAARQHTWLRALVLASALVASIAVAFAVATWNRSSPAPPASAVHMTALLPPGVTVTRGPGMVLSLALSPDGKTLVIAGTDANGQRLYQRTLDRADATPLEGTDGALSPFFSPDGQWIGFFADRYLKRVPARGGTAIDITAAPGYPGGASWGIDDRIVFASGHQSPLRVVPANGGSPETLTTPDGGQGHRFPDLLPDGRVVLFSDGSQISALDLTSRRRIDLGPGTAPRYVSSGHLIFRRGTSILATPFDPARVELTGPVVPVVDDVAIERGAGGPPHLAVSSSGSMAYVPAARSYALALIEPDGTERLLTEDLLLENPQFSPNGRRLVVTRTRRAGEASDLWVYDIESATPPFRLTLEGGRAPVWTPDGASITYSVPLPSEQAGLYTKSADGRGDARQLLPLKRFHWLVGWTPQHVLAYGTMDEPVDGVSRSSILAVQGTGTRYVVGPGDTWGGRLSPDGRRLVYYSLDSGYFEIYVTEFPDTGARWLIAEGTDPAWSPDGSEIYYRSGSRLMAARIDLASGVRVLSRRVVFEPFMPPLYDDYAIHPNGRTLAVVRPVGDARGREIAWVLNWLDELPRLTRQ
jgi:eukaryotic-like serine/threonine-protein kinase